MEIHPPHGSIGSVKDFFLHLSMIVIGILIALGLEGAVQWVHHRGLAREARNNVAAEISDNQRRTVESLPAVVASEQQLREMIAAIHTLQANRNAKIHELRLDWTFMDVEDTNWNSAINTGAISYMDMADVQRYTKLYSLQRAFVSAQNRGFESAAQVQGLGTLLDKDFKSLSDRQLEQAENTVGMALANTRIIQQIGQTLTAEYAKFGGGEQPQRSAANSK